jgi:hypothetical protein
MNKILLALVLACSASASRALPWPRPHRRGDCGGDRDGSTAALRRAGDGSSGQLRRPTPRRPRPQRPPVANKGDIAWMLVCTALVIMMSIPALALFYGGLVRSKNMLSG